MQISPEARGGDRVIAGFRCPNTSTRDRTLIFFESHRYSFFFFLIKPLNDFKSRHSLEHIPVNSCKIFPCESVTVGHYQKSRSFSFNCMYMSV